MSSFINSPPGSPIVAFDIPPGWSTNISIISRKAYDQLSRVNYTTHGTTHTHYFANQRGKQGESMQDLVTGSKTLFVPPKDAAATIDFTFFHSTTQTVRGRNLEDKSYLSNRLYAAAISKPKDGPKEMPNYNTYIVFVEDVKPAVGNYDDVIATVHMIEGVTSTSPANGIFENAALAINNFQSSVGIPDEYLVPPPPYTPSSSLANLTVGIIGAGAAGLYTAMILDSLDIKYEILEASGRHGGRLYTYQFPELPGEYQYFDAGAMRYPDISFMKRTFDLVRNRLRIGNKFIPVIMSNPNTFLHYNGYRAKKGEYQASDQSGGAPVDLFKVGFSKNNKGGYIPEEYLKKGHKTLYQEALEPLRQYFVTDSFPDAFKKLMELDMYSVRDHLSINMGYPNSVIRWIETMEWRTGMFDASLTETVLADLAFDDPRNRSEGKQTEWFCFDGGSRVLSDAMLDSVKTKPKYYQRVTAIRDSKEDGNEAIVLTVDGRNDPRLANNYTKDRKYSNVICTLPLSVLRTVDLDNLYLSVNQRNALREVLYSPSIKFGIQFKTAWWEKLGIVGGQTHTDRPARSVVYPSHGPGLGGSQRSNVLIASYNGMQDSQRLGALMKGRGSPEEKMLLNLLMNDLAVIHDIPIDEIWEQFVDYYPWDWYSSSLSLGAFAWFGPGQFRDVYPHLTLPGSLKQRLFFAGDAISASHGWVVGALNSAWRCVRAMLIAHQELNPDPEEDILKKFASLWGNSEEWDNKTLETHVYIGRELAKLPQT